MRPPGGPTAGPARLRDSGPADFESLWALDRECFPPGIAYSRGELRAFLAQPGTETIVAERGGRVAAFVLGGRRGATDGHVVTLDVTARARRHGLGRRLLGELERRFRAAGVRGVRLETAVTNLPAIALYERLGYRKVARLRGYYGPGLDAWRMAKALEGSRRRDPRAPRRVIARPPVREPRPASWRQPDHGPPGLRGARRPGHTGAMARAREVVWQAAGREVVITNPDKVFFPQAGHTKLDLVRYYAAVAEGALRGVAGRPVVLKRYVDGAGGEPFFQKRAPERRPAWVETVELRFPSGRTAREVVLRDLAQLLWTVNLGCIDLNPHPLRADDLEHPDELRVDLDPGPGVGWDEVRRVALLVRDVLEEHGLRGWPKTSGSRGMHVNVRIERRWTFDQVRRAALALAREVERRAPGRATSRWWKEERRGVFLDYNQNAKDRTVASAWSVRPTPDARVSMPLDWDEVPDCDPAAFTLLTAPARLAGRGDAAAGIDAAAGSLEGLLALSAAQEAAGLGDAPWPPHYRKGRDEPPRVAPSRRRAPDRHAPRRAGRRPAAPLVTVARAARREDALAGLERWKARHPAAAARLEADDVLVDSMRGRSSTWTRVRVNLRHVPEAERPPEEPPVPDYDPWRRPPSRPRASRAPKTRSSS